MNALYEIISQLVAAVPGPAWREQRFFPFGDLEDPRGQLYDVLFFSQHAQGALGIAWIDFEHVDDVLTLPFRLSRHSEDGALICLAPWSLREASADSAFYQAWKNVLHGKARVFTERGGVFEEKTRTGRAGLQALRVLNEPNAVYVRVESQEAFRLFRTFSRTEPASLEVEMLDYLTHQKVFHNFPELISFFEYSSEHYSGVKVAHTTRYVKNNGTVWQNLVPLLQSARFPIVGLEYEADSAWNQALGLVEKLARLMGDFHRAMTFARQIPALVPESNSGEAGQAWLQGFWEGIQEAATTLQEAQFAYPRFKSILNSLLPVAESVWKRVAAIDNLGLRIRTHGRPHLGHILMTRDSLILFDFGERGVFPSVASWKHSCLRDLSVMVLSLYFAWQMSERHDTSPVVEELFGFDAAASGVSEFRVSAREGATLEELEERLIRFYLNVLKEDPGSSALLPPTQDGWRALYDFLLLHRAVVEAARDFVHGNPRIKISLRIVEALCRRAQAEGVS